MYSLVLLLEVRAFGFADFQKQLLSQGPPLCMRATTTVPTYAYVHTRAPLVYTFGSTVVFKGVFSRSDGYGKRISIRHISEILVHA